MHIRNVSCLYAHQIEHCVGLFLGPLDRDFQNSWCFDVTETAPSGGIFYNYTSARWGCGDRHNLTNTVGLRSTQKLRNFRIYLFTGMIG